MSPRRSCGWEIRILLPCAIRGRAVGGAAVQAQLFELAGIERMLEDFFQILADVNGVVFLARPEDQVAIVDANDFPLDQGFALAIPDAEGVEPRRSAQARFGVVVTVVEKGLGFR